MRCAEELVKLQLEMDMTYLGYHARADIWLAKAQALEKCGSSYAGHVAKGYEMEDMWRRLASRARSVFEGLSPNPPPVPTADF